VGTGPRLRGTPAQNLQVRTAWIIEATRRVEPDLSDELLRRAIELAAPRRAGRAVLASELLARPEVLTCGLSDSSPVTQAYLEQLVAAGARRVVLATCELCGRGPTHGVRLPSGGRACNRCTRRMRVQACSVCGQVGPRGSRGLQGEPVCERCTDRARSPRLVTFVDALGSVESPRNAMQWLTRGRAQDVLGAMVRGDQGLDHATLDRAAGQRRGRALAIEHLRQLLVVSGALPPRDEYMSRLERTIEARLSTAHPGDARVLRSYATWHVLSGARRRVARGRPSQRIGRGALAAMTIAETFLAWLRELGLDREAVPQAAVDHWLTQHPGRAVHLATFLRWAQRRGLPSKVHIDSQLRWFPTTFMHADTQWTLVQRLLHDDTVAPGDRLVACLVMLYGQPLRRVAQLRHSDISTTGAQTMIKLGSEAVVLIGPLDEIAAQMLHGQARDRWVQGLAKSFPNQQDWLFPGRVAGQPIGMKALQERMKKLGIEARGARNTAVLNLARDVPASVLADLLGITAATAERWRELAGGNWTTYAPIGDTGSHRGDLLGFRRPSARGLKCSGTVVGAKQGAPSRGVRR